MNEVRSGEQEKESIFLVLFSNIIIGYQSWNSQNACQKSRNEKPHQTASGSALFV